MTRMENELKMARAKATEISIAAAKAKGTVERTLRKMVWKTNKICGRCAAGTVRIRQRRAEINAQQKRNKRLDSVRRYSNRKAAELRAAMREEDKIKTDDKKYKKRLSFHTSSVRSKPVSRHVSKLPKNARTI